MRPTHSPRPWNYPHEQHTQPDHEHLRVNHAPNTMPDTLTLTMAAALINLLAGAALVWTAYSGLEHSPTRAISTTSVFAAAIITGNWFTGNAITFQTWTQFEFTTITAVIGAAIGISAALLMWEPAPSPSAPPVEAEQAALDDMMQNRHKIQDAGGDD
ncbi:hypothetical protein U3A55_04960 [Salarchaeum sp. III]|uniref:hypothetical protein n=1 Tax=Salarchaeum sp. III TaxID=3107927 RepID=UPI002EDA1646